MQILFAGLDSSGEWVGLGFLLSCVLETELQARFECDFLSNELVWRLQHSSTSSVPQSQDGVLMGEHYLCLLWDYFELIYYLKLISSPSLLLGIIFRVERKYF